MGKSPLPFLSTNFMSQLWLLKWVETISEVALLYSWHYLSLDFTRYLVMKHKLIANEIKEHLSCKLSKHALYFRK